MYKMNTYLGKIITIHTESHIFFGDILYNYDCKNWDDVDRICKDKPS